MENNECRFCSGKVIRPDFVGTGVKTMSMMLNAILGMDDEPEECSNGVQLQHGNMLCFDNSAQEYALLSVEILYCPFCGNKLETEEEKDADE